MEKYFKKMRKCPFCGSDHTDGFTSFTNLKDGRAFLQHFCHPEIEEVVVSIGVYGKTHDECVERWNGDAEVQESESL